MISIIVAMDKNGLIGDSKKGLPWHYKKDLKYFKNITMGKTIVMGSKTYETIGRPLVGRTNVVLTRTKKYKDYNIITYTDFNKLINSFTPEADIMVIGGAEIYRLALPYADKLYVTHIAAEYTGDVYFPEVNWAQYRIVSEKKDKELKFVVYEKRKEE